MDPLTISVSVIAVIQMADRVIELCKKYLGAARDAPADLRLILIETSSIKSVLDNLHFLTSCSHGPSTLESLAGDDGPIEGCRHLICELEALLSGPLGGSHENGVVADGGTKRQRVKSVLAALAWPTRESKSKKLLGQLSQHKETISLALTTDSARDIKEIKAKTTQIQNTLTDLQKQQIHKWLQSTDPRPLHYRACEQYETGTGDWMLRSDEWQAWLAGKTRCLWIHGIPGAGKTILASHMIESFNNLNRSDDDDDNSDSEGKKTQKLCTVYFYCYFGHNQDEAVPFLRWTVSQLCRHADLVPPRLHRLYKEGGQPNLVDLMHSLAEIVKEFERVYLFVDAVDESIPRENLLRVIRDLATDSRFDNVRTVVTSRQYIDIENVMSEISVPMSMTNPLLDEAIRIYVGAQLEKHLKLRRWPAYLQEEVLEALSAKAKGMFRWVVCQIDALQRLKPDSGIVRNALANLPKTLYDTYERIFLQIPEEASTFVHHALQWIFSYREMVGNNISSPVLLEAIQKSTSELAFSANDYVYDDDLLREFCGCLVTLMPEARRSRIHVHQDSDSGESDDPDDAEARAPFQVMAVSFAHYTVWEFLISARIRIGSAKSFAVDGQSAMLEFAKMAMIEALNPEAMYRNVQSKEWESDERDPEIVCHSFYNVFGFSCIATSMLAVHKYGELIDERDDLRALAFDLLNPTKPHLAHLEEAGRRIESEFAFFESETGLSRWFQLWRVIWITPPTNSNARHLLNLLLTDQSCRLPRRFFAGIEKETVLRDRLDVEIRGGYVDGPGLHLEVSLVELCASVHRGMGPRKFWSLVDFGAGFFDPWLVIMAYITNHNHEYNCGEQCALERLLQIGAWSPNIPAGLLQAAVAARDAEGVKTLLKWGADPNGIGDIMVDELDKFSFLRGRSPLHILNKSINIYGAGNGEGWKWFTVPLIEETLLQYGARDFTIPEKTTDLPSCFIHPKQSSSESKKEEDAVGDEPEGSGIAEDVDTGNTKG
ncbi:hypothetical protein B0T19DRAFT_424000 [Cercophora scortea]|uniref:Nephrocystin 3-like N-terminal domain-containing protein n=1 Tax=Cercophora scortea TaxID=314031 RepID=A0AAE0IN52_9PEZI|nr:hypothetical protein B0T19DRAFT_424000 [Cercophora scortea]